MNQPRSNRCAAAFGWLLYRFSFYLKKGCRTEEALDFAIDDCLTEGVLFSFFQHHREEIKRFLYANLSSAPQNFPAKVVSR